MKIQVPGTVKLFLFGTQDTVRRQCPPPGLLLLLLVGKLLLRALSLLLSSASRESTPKVAGWSRRRFGINCCLLNWCLFFVSDVEQEAVEKEKGSSSWRPWVK